MAKQSSILEIVLTAKNMATQGIRNMGRDLDTLSGRITAISTGFLAVRQVAADVAGAFQATIGEAIRQSRELVSLSRRLGETAENLQSLEFVASQSNLAFNTLTMGLQRATRRVAEAARGGGEAAAAIDELGLSAERLAQLSPAELLEVLADALSGVERQSDRVRLAFKFFDSEGVSILEAFGSDGGDAVRELREEFDDLNLAMSEDSVEAFDAVGRRVDVLEKRFRKLKRTVAEFLLSTLFPDDPLSRLEADRIVAAGPQAIDLRYGNQVQPRRARAGHGLLPPFPGPIGPILPPAPDLKPPKEFEEGLQRANAHMTGIREEFEGLGALYDQADQWQAEWNSELDKANEKVQEMSDMMEHMAVVASDLAISIGDELGDAFADAIVYGEDFADSLKDAIKSIGDLVIRTLLRIAARTAVVGFLGSLFGAGSFGSAFRIASGVYGGGGGGGDGGGIASTRRQSAVINVDIQTGFANQAAGIEAARAMVAYMRQAGVNV